MGEERAQQLATAGALYHTVLEPQAGFSIPPGFLGVEAVADETDVVGIRLLCMSSTESIDNEAYKSFKRLVNFLQPTSGNGVAPAAAHKLALTVASFIE